MGGLLESVHCRRVAKPVCIMRWDWCLSILPTTHTPPLEAHSSPVLWLDCLVLQRIGSTTRLVSSSPLVPSFVLSPPGCSIHSLQDCLSGAVHVESRTVYSPPCEGALGRSSSSINTEQLAPHQAAVPSHTTPGSEFPLILHRPDRPATEPPQHRCCSVVDCRLGLFILFSGGCLSDNIVRRLCTTWVPDVRFESGGWSGENTRLGHGWSERVVLSRWDGSYAMWRSNGTAEGDKTRNRRLATRKKSDGGWPGFALQVRVPGVGFRDNTPTKS